MDDFNQNLNNEGEENTHDSINDFVDMDDDTPVWNKVEYAHVEKVDTYKPMGKGLKIFCVVMALVVALTGATAIGFFVGKNETIKRYSYIGKPVEVDLAAKPTDTDPSTPAQVYANVSDSVVGIRVYNDYYDGSASNKVPPYASGVVYSEDGYIVTNDHIYADIVGTPKFKIYMQNGKEYEAVYVAGDVRSDLAVLKIESEDKFRPAIFGDSDQLINGETVVAIGRPTGPDIVSSITSGIISLSSIRVSSKSTAYSARLIQTSSPINPGSSGGALFNMYGQVVGITTSKLAGGVYDAVGFAIPTRTMKRVVEQLVLNGKVVDRAKLGISYNMIDSVTAEINGSNVVGLLVTDVSDDSDVYGTLTKGDVITHVNGIPITNDDIILDIIEDLKAGDKIIIKVLSGDVSVELDVTLRADIGTSSYPEEKK